MSAASSPVRKERIQFIDAARGIAILLVVVSHFGFTFFPNQRDTVPTVLRLIGMVASPTFVILSGLLIGFLYATKPQGFPAFRIKLVDRALFLLTIGRLILLASHAPFYTTHFLSLTDALAICLLVQPWLITLLPPRYRAELAAGLYGASWMTMLLWHPHAASHELFKETVFGTTSGETFYTYAFPILPWLSANLAATALGEYIGRLYARGRFDAVQRILNATGAAAFACAAALKAGYTALRLALGTAPSWLGPLRMVSSPFQKQPPSPAYLLFYGSIGLALLSTALWLERRYEGRALLSPACVVGQSSLFVYMSHWFPFLLIVLPERQWLPHPELWPLYLAAFSGAVVSSAFLWYRQDGNRFITVGYARIHRSLTSDFVTIRSMAAAWSRTSHAWSAHGGARR